MDENQVAALLATLKESGSSDYNVLDLSNCFLSSSTVAEILSVLETSPSITELYLPRNHIGPEGVARLCNILRKSKQLRVLDLRNTQLNFADIRKLSTALENNFTIVDFRIDEPASEGIRDVPFSLRLDAPPTIAQISDLKWSVFTRKEFDKLRDRIQDITAVNRKVYECVTNKRDELSLYNRHISRLPEVIMMSHLRILDLRNNNLTQLPLSLEDLQSLEQLYLDSNRLSSLPHSVGSLQRLLILSVRKNNLAQLPGSLPLLVNLQQLFVTDNAIKEIPLMLGSLRGLKKLDLSGNPCVAKVSSSVTDMLEYIREQYKSSDAKKNLRMKLAIVGGQQVGKTSFVRFLKSRLSATSKKGATPQPVRRGSTNRSNSTSSPAIDADTIEVDEFEVNHPSIPNNEHLLFITYDFGGEEYYQATHQFFLSPQSMYILVFDLLRPEEEYSQVSFWLHLINERAPDSPVVLVGTHCDDKRCNRAYIEGTMRSIFERVKTWDRFPEAYWFSVDSVTGTNMKEFLKTLVEITLQQPNVNVKTPESFLQLENKVVAIKETKPLPPIMMRETLNKLAKECGVPDMDIVAALEYLFSIGVAVHFNDSKLKLDNFVVLGRRWLVDFWVPVMKLRNSETLARPAVVKPGDITALWKAPKYPQDVHQFFLGLLLKFELALPLENGQDLFIPYMLPTTPPDSFHEIWKEDPEAAEQRRYFAIDGRLPQHVFSRLLCRLIQGVTNWDILSYWRTGILLKQGSQATVVIQLDVHLSLLKLRVRGPQQVMKLIELDEVIEGLFQDWLNLDVNVKIPCRHCLQEGHDQDAYLFAREDLEEAVSRHTNPFVNCMRENRPRQVHTAWLVPDIAMTSFSGEKIDFKDLELRKKIGEGAYATVYEGRWRNQQVAVKQLNLSSIVSARNAGAQNIFAEFRREVWLMSGLQNDNLVVLKAITMEPFCMILEYMERGSLYHFLKDPSNAVDWVTRLLFARDVAQAMDFLHSLVPAIVHRDLKSPNILLTLDESEGRLKAKVSDFGLSRSLTLRGEFDSRSLKTNNPVWLAPEIMQGKDYNEKADVYSYGVVLWEMLSRADFFNQYSFMNDIVIAVTSGQRPDIPSSEEDPYGVQEDYSALIRDCWGGDPATRPTFSNILRRIDEMLKKVPELPKPRKVSSKNIPTTDVRVIAESSSPRNDSVLSDGDGLDSDESTQDEIDSDVPWSGTDLDSMASSADEGSGRRIIRPSVAPGTTGKAYKKGREVHISMNILNPSERSTGLVGKARARRESQIRGSVPTRSGVVVSSSDPDDSVDIWQMLNEEPPEEFRSKSGSKKDKKDKKSGKKGATSSSGATSERSDLEEEVGFLEALRSLNPDDPKAKKKNREEAEDRAIVAVIRRLLKPKKKRPSSISESDGRSGPENVTSDDDLDLVEALRAVGPGKTSAKASKSKGSASDNDTKRGSATSDEDPELDLISALKALPPSAFEAPTRRMSTRAQLLASKQQQSSGPSSTLTVGSASSTNSALATDTSDEGDAVDFWTALRSIESVSLPGASAAEKRKAEDRALLNVLKRYTEDFESRRSSREEADESTSSPPSKSQSQSLSIPIAKKPQLTKKDSNEKVDILDFLSEEPPADLMGSSPPSGSESPATTSSSPTNKKPSRWGTLRKLLIRGNTKATTPSSSGPNSPAPVASTSKQSPQTPTASATPTSSSAATSTVEEDDEEVDFFTALRSLPAPPEESKSPRARSDSKKEISSSSSKKSSKQTSKIESVRSDVAGPRVAASAIHIMSDDEGEDEVDFFTALLSTEPPTKAQLRAEKKAAKEARKNKPAPKEDERSALITIFRGLVRKKINRERRRETRQPGASTDEDYDDEDEQLDFYQALQTLDKSARPQSTSPRQLSVPSSGSSTARSNSGAPSPKGKEKQKETDVESSDADEDDDQSMDFLTALKQIPATEKELSPRTKPHNDDTDQE